MPSQRQCGGLLWLTLVVVSLWLAEGGLLEEGLEVKMNSVNQKTDKFVFDPPPCIDTGSSGVVPCDTNPKCCLKDSPKVTEAGTDYCCPPNSSQYPFKTLKEFLCACAI